MYETNTFRWITNNIAYAADELFCGNKSAIVTSPEEVLKCGKTVCAGYSSLFEKLGSLMDLEVRIISGFAKGFGWSPGQLFKEGSKSDHAWNAVKIGANWFLLDATWGTGYCDDNCKFHWKLDEHYFLTNPKEFVSAHFPIEAYKENDQRWSSWQLMPKPVTLEEYNSLMKGTSAFFSLNILSSNPFYFLDVEEEKSFTLTSSDPLDLKAHLCRKGTNKEFPGSCCVELKKGYREAEFLLVAPCPGTFHLNVFGKRHGAEGSLNLLLMYVVNMKSVADPPKKTFPINDGFWGPNASFDKLKLDLPDMDGAKIFTDSQTGLAKLSIKCGVDVELIHGLKAAEDVQLPSGIVLKDHVFKQHLGEDTCCFLVRPPAPGYYKLSVFGKKGDNSKKSFPEVLTGEFHDQVNAKWIVIRGLLRGHNNLHCGRPNPGQPIGCPGVGCP
jgi:hypothetical protein